MKKIILCTLVGTSLYAVEDQSREWTVFSGWPKLEFHSEGSDRSSSDANASRSTSSKEDLTGSDSLEGVTSSSGHTTPPEKESPRSFVYMSPSITHIFYALGGAQRNMRNEFFAARWDHVQTQLYALKGKDQELLIYVWNSLQSIPSISAYKSADVYEGLRYASRDIQKEGLRYASRDIQKAVTGEFQLVAAKLFVVKTLISTRGQHQYRPFYDVLLDEAKTWLGYAQYAQLGNRFIFDMSRNLATNVFSLDALAPLYECLSLARSDRTIGSNNEQAVLASIANAHEFILRNGHCKQQDRAYHSVAGYMVAGILENFDLGQRIQESILTTSKQFPLSSLEENVVCLLTERQQAVIGTFARPFQNILKIRQ